MLFYDKILMISTKLLLSCYTPYTSNGKLTHLKKLEMWPKCVKETIFKVWEMVKTMVTWRGCASYTDAELNMFLFFSHCIGFNKANKFLIC